MAIDLGMAQQKYAQNTPASAQFWAQAATNKANKWEERAKSMEAEQNYAAGVQFAVQNQLRAKGLQNVTAQDYAAGVQNAVNVYQQKTSVASGKWQQRFAPYADVIDRVVSTLPARQPGNAAANVMNRVAPIAQALQQAKLSGVVSRFTPLGSTPTTPTTTTTPTPTRRLF